VTKRCDCGNKTDLTYETEHGVMCPTCWNAYYDKRMKSKRFKCLVEITSYRYTKEEFERDLQDKYCCSTINIISIEEVSK